MSERDTTVRGSVPPPETGVVIPVAHRPEVPVGTLVVGPHGEPLGQVAAVYADNATGRPAWAAVQDARHTAVVPVELSHFDGVTLHIPFGPEQLRSAPVHDPSALITYEQGDDLARHYGLIPPARVLAEPSVADPSVADPPASDEPGVQVTRSEERLSTGTVDVVVGRARLVTSIVTEDQTFTIPVRRQEVRLVYDAIPDEEQVISETGPAGYVHEIVLHTEQVLFTTRIVPVERVRMVRRVVTEERVVTTHLEAERVDIDRTGNGQVDPGPRPTRRY